MDDSIEEIEKKVLAMRDSIEAVLSGTGDVLMLAEDLYGRPSAFSRVTSNLDAFTAVRILTRIHKDRESLVDLLNFAAAAAELAKAPPEKLLEAAGIPAEHLFISIVSMSCRLTGPFAAALVPGLQALFDHADTPSNALLDVKARLDEHAKAHDEMLRLFIESHDNRVGAYAANASDFETFAKHTEKQWKEKYAKA